VITAARGIQSAALSSDDPVSASIEDYSAMKSEKKFCISRPLLLLSFLIAYSPAAGAEELAQAEKDSFVLAASEDPYMYGYDEIASVVTVDIAAGKDEVRITDTTVLAEDNGEILTVVSEDIAPNYPGEDSIAYTSVSFYSETLNGPAGCPGDSGPTGDSGDSGSSADSGSYTDSPNYYPTYGVVGDSSR
jgi:hypothetical protein